MTMTTTKLAFGLGRRRIGVLGITLAALAVTVLPSAHATFKGQNGRILFEAPAGANRQLFTVEPDGTGLEQVTHFKDSGGTNGAWSADGSRILFTRHWAPETPNEKIVIYTMNADGSGLRALPRAGKLAVSPAFFPSGRRIVFLNITAGERLMVINANGGGLRSAGIPGYGGDPACVSPDGKRVTFLRTKAGDDALRAIFVAGLFGHGLKRVSPWATYGDKIDCSPDGKRIVFTKPGGDNPGPGNMYTMRADGSDIIQLTHETGADVRAYAESWSPDGNEIVFAVARGDTFRMYTMHADGTGVEQLTDGPDDHWASWGSHS
jgi:Tol biopolymer transport system component